MNLELTGILFSAGEAIQVTEKLTKREFILQVQEVDGEYEKTQYYPMQLLNANADKLTQADTGKTMTIKANLDGRSFTRKDGTPGFMLGITAWFVNIDKNAPIAMDAEEVDPEDQSGDASDLPF